jgi:hypothetical protein
MTRIVELDVEPSWEHIYQDETSIKDQILTVQRMMNLIGSIHDHLVDIYIPVQYWDELCLCDRDLKWPGKEVYLTAITTSD